MTDSLLRDLESSGRAEGEHIGNDMLRRVISSGSDLPRPRYLRHIYKPEKQVEPVKKEAAKKKSLI